MKVAMIDVDALFLWHAGLAVCLSFLIGIEFHKYQRTEGQGLGFGTTRTLTLVGLLGFLLHALDGSGLLFALGFAVLALWLALYYRRRLDEDYLSLMAPIVCMMVYILGLLASSVVPWFVVAYAVLVVVLLSAKPRIRAFADTVSGQELSTVTKFVIMVGVALPLLPDRQMADFIPVTYRQTGLAVVAVSGISYLSYVAQAYLLKSRGTLVVGMLGGLYSSTATTFALSEQARTAAGNSMMSPALVLATAMMYVRLLVLCGILAPASLSGLAVPFVAAFLSSLVVAFLMVWLRKRTEDSPPPALGRHPLEFNTALLFAFLFVLFAGATNYVVGEYSYRGLHVMAFIVGLTDIDPFVLSLLTGKMHVDLASMVDAVLIATASNNFLKAGYALALARNRSVLMACGWLALLAVLTLVYAHF